jgi:hypothetical protein
VIANNTADKIQTKEFDGDLCKVASGLLIGIFGTDCTFGVVISVELLFLSLFFLAIKSKSNESQI